jgi:hypothetical protein
MTVYTKARLRKAVKTGVFGDAFTDKDGQPPIDRADLHMELVRVDRFYPDSYRAKVTFRDSIIDNTPDENPRTELVYIGSTFMSTDIEIMVIPDGTEINDGEIGERCIIPTDEIIGVVLALGGSYKDRGGILLTFVHMPDEDAKQFEKDIILLRNSDSFMKIKNDEIILNTPKVTQTIPDMTITSEDTLVIDSTDVNINDELTMNELANIIQKANSSITVAEDEISIQAAEIGLMAKVTLVKGDSLLVLDEDSIDIQAPTINIDATVLDIDVSDDVNIDATDNISFTVGDDVNISADNLNLGNTNVTKGGLPAKQRVLVGEFDIPQGSPVTSATITGLNGDVDAVYEFEFNITVLTGDANSFLFKPNGNNWGETFTQWHGYWSAWLHSLDQVTMAGQLVRTHGIDNPRYVHGTGKMIAKGLLRGLATNYITRSSSNGVLANYSHGNFQETGNITSITFALVNGGNFAGWMRVFTYR